MENRIEQTIIPVGLDFDTADTELEPTSVRYMLNCDVANPDQAGQGKIRNKKGNVLIEFDLPAGVNTCINAYEDEAGKYLYYFIHNSNFNHGIYRFDTTTNEVHTVLQDHILGFTVPAWEDGRKALITGVRKQEHLLGWTDDHMQPGQLDVERAVRAGKKLKANIYFGTDLEQAWADGSSFIFHLTFGNITQDVTILTTSGLSSLTDLATAYANAFNGNADVNPYYTAESKGVFVEIEAKGTDDRDQDSATASHDNCWLIWQNCYPKPYLQEYVYLVKYPPNRTITGQYKTDVKRKLNQVDNKVFQFSFRYVYVNNEKSVLAPFSTLLYPDEGNANYIELTFLDSSFTRHHAAIIKRVEILVREGNLGNWKLVDSLEQFEYLPGTYRFYNDGVYSAIDIADATKLFDAVPLKSKSLEIVKNRLFLGNNLEGYDPVDLDVSVDVGFNENTSQKVWTIKGRVRIINPLIQADTTDFWADDAREVYSGWQPIHDTGRNPSGFPTVNGIMPVFGGIGKGGLDDNDWEDDLHDKYDQRIPEAGFIMYLAGTPYYAISRQYWDWFEVGGDTKSVELKSKDPLVYDTHDRGWTVYNRNNKYREAVRELMYNHRTYSDFVIQGVPPGTYILRVASHWCSKGDVLGKGSMYDLNNGLEWQKTSSPVTMVGGVPGTEYVITLGEDGGVFDLRTLDNYGDTLIADLTYPTPDNSMGEFAVVQTGYVIDGGGSNQSAELARGLAMERQMIDFSFNGSYFATVHTDHNGYFWLTDFRTIVGIVRAKVYSGSGGGGGPILIKDYNQEKYLGGLKEVQGGTLNNDDFDIDFRSSVGTSQFIVINRNAGATAACRTEVKGRLVDQGGNGIPNMLVMIEGVGRWEITDSQGNYSFIVYVNAVEGFNDLHKNMIVSYPYYRGHITDGPQIVDVNIPQFLIGGDYNNDHPFTVDDQQYDANPTSGKGFLKRGGVYQYALAYYDEALRTNGANTSPATKIYVPRHTEDLHDVDPIQYPVADTFQYGTPKISWEIRHQPPVWATHYQWLRSELLNINDTYLQWVVQGVKYVSGFDTSDSPVLTTFATKTAKFLMLSLENFKTYRRDNKESVNEITIGYTFNTGDRLYFMKDSGNNFFTEYYDLPIKEARGMEIVVECLNEMPELKAGTMIEIYNPEKSLERTVLYEIDELYKIEFGQHSKTTGVFKGGDTYQVTRRISAVDGTGQQTYYNAVCESPSVSDFFKSKACDIGRPLIEDRNIRQRRYAHGIRFSGMYVNESQLNGFASFEPLNNAFLPAQYGGIQKMQISKIGSRETLLTIMDTETISLYIGEAQFNDVKGEKIIAISDGVIGAQALLEGGFGTTHPESVVEVDGRVYFLCALRGKVIRYSGNGNFAISDYKAMNHFAARGLQMIESQKATYAYGGFDRTTNEYILSTVIYAGQFTLPGPDGQPITNYLVDGETIAFNEITNRWSTFYSFIPEYMGKIGKKLLSLVAGKLWRHNADGVPRNNFYGVQYTTKIRPVFNQGKDTVKVWKNLSYKSNAAWDANPITTAPTSHNPGGQETELLKSDFALDEGVFWGALLRDKNTPNIVFPLIEGEEMRSEVLVVDLENNDTTEVYLQHVYANGFTSQITK